MIAVVPAPAGIQRLRKPLGSRLRRGDVDAAAPIR